MSRKGHREGESEKRARSIVGRKSSSWRGWELGALGAGEMWFQRPAGLGAGGQQGCLP